MLHNPLHFDRYRRLGTTTPRDYAALFARIAKGELVSREASAEMLSILRQQHYNTMLTHDFPQYYLDCEETGAPELYLLHRWEEESCQTNPSSPPDWCCGRP